MSSPPSVAVIGAGLHASKVHFPILSALQKEGKIVLKVICDLNLSAAQTAKEAFGFEETSTSGNDVVGRSDIDAVYIFGTATMHYEYGLLALQNGKHVFVEKPPAPDATSLQHMADTAMKQHVECMVGLNRRFYAGVEILRKEIDGRSRILSLEGVFHMANLRTPPRYGATTWLEANGIHALDLLMYLQDSKMPEYVYSAQNGTSLKEVPQNQATLLVWENGTHATCMTTNESGARSERYAVHTPDISYECDRTTLTVFRKGEEPVRTEFSFDEGAGFVTEHEEFVAVITGDLPRSRSSATLVVPTLRVIERILKGEQSESQKVSSSEYAPSLPVQDVRMSPKTGALYIQTATLAPHLPELQKRFSLIFPDDLEANPEKGSEVIAAVTGPDGGPLTDERLAQFPNLALLGVVGSSLKKYNPESVLKRGVPIVSGAPAYAEAVAEFVVMLAILGMRQAGLSHDVMRHGGWGVKDTTWKDALRERLMPLGAHQSFRRLFANTPLWALGKQAIGAGGVPEKRKSNNFSGATVGIIGYGPIARKVVVLLAPFDCRIFLYSEHCSKEEAAHLGVEKVTLAEALGADVVTLHRGLSPETFHSIGEKEIAHMKSGAVFVNTARGGIVDTEALLRRLKRNDLFACLDVFEEEPLPAGSPLRRLSNVFLTSHLSGGTATLKKRAAAYVAEALPKFLDGEEVESVVRSLEHLHRMT